MDIFVLTSNAYTHCLRPFAHLFNKYWGEFQAVTVAGFDERPTGLPRNFTFRSLGKQETHTWSQGARALLDIVPGDQFILFLEDYFLDRPARINVVQALWDWMEDNPGVAKIDLTNDRLKVPYTELESVKMRGFMPPLIQTADNAPFQTSLQAAIWRKDFLARFLNDNETPWEFEKKGTGRVIFARKNKSFTGLVLGAKFPPVWYINAIGGEGNMPGEWALKRFPQWMITELKAKGMLG